MPSVPVPEKVQKWRRWIDEDIRPNVVGMYFRRQIWVAVNDILETSPVGQMPSAFWDLYHEGYAAAQGIAIRRQGDDDRNVSWLRRLIGEMSRSADQLTRDGYVALLDENQAKDPLMVQRANRDWNLFADDQGNRFSRAIALADATELEQAAARVNVYVNEHLAHDMADPTVEATLTWDELHSAIDMIGSKYQKYAAILTGSVVFLNDMPILGDWEAIFRVPWIEPTTN